MLEEQPEFHIGQIPDSRERYVAWCDVMGIASISSRSTNEAAIKVFKLHIACLEAYNNRPGPQKQQIDIYPMMDGMYIISSSRNALLDVIHSIFVALGRDNIDADEMHHVLVVKATIAFGPIIQGEQLSDHNDVLADTSSKERTMVGLPIIQAFLSEKKSPPFGVYIHESARAFSPEGDDPFNFAWWKWYESNDEEYDVGDLGQELQEKLNSYYKWSENNSKRINYPKEDIQRHRNLMNQYLPDNENDE